MGPKYLADNQRKQQKGSQLGDHKNWEYRVGIEGLWFVGERASVDDVFQTRYACSP